MTVDITKTPLEAAGEKPAFFDDPAVDRVLAIAMAVAEEVAVTGERLDTLERVLEDKNILARDELAGYRPGPEVVAERLSTHKAFVERLLRIIDQELKALGDRPAP